LKRFSISIFVVFTLPEWFKTTAEWWTEGKITDEEFMRSVEYLQNSGVIRPH